MEDVRAIVGRPGDEQHIRGLCGVFVQAEAG